MNINAAVEDLSRWIGYFQHERLAHLIVTALFSVLTLLGLILLVIAPSSATLGLVGLVAILLIFYIRHYYILENGTQKLYGLMDQLTDIQREKERMLAEKNHPPHP